MKKLFSLQNGDLEIVSWSCPQDQDAALSHDKSASSRLDDFLARAAAEASSLKGDGLPEGHFIVLCGLDREEPGVEPLHTVATRTVFATENGAREYASTVNASRRPVVISTNQIIRLISGWRGGGK